MCSGRVELYYYLNITHECKETTLAKETLGSKMYGSIG